MTTAQYAQRNVRLFIVAKIFTKRVFLPLAAIYFMQEADFSFAQIGMLGSFYYIINFLVDVPTGMFADRKGRALSLRIGALMNVCSTLIYALFPNKPAIVFATALEAVGYGFMLGAGEALIHDSLTVLGKVSSYTKVLSRTQSLSLIVNAVLIALVPMTYSIDHRIPFLIGTLAYASLAIVTLFMRDVAILSKEKVGLGSLRLIFSVKGALTFAICYGIVGALYTAPSDMVNLAFKQLGMDPSLLGWVFSAGAIAGAIFGFFFHLVKKMGLIWVLILDGFFAIIPYIAVYLQSLPALVASTIMSISVWRYRRILYQEKMLLKFPGQPKATLMSVMSNLEGFQQMWMPLVAGLAISGLGLKSGFGAIALFGAIVSTLFVFAGQKFFQESNK